MIPAWRRACAFVAVLALVVAACGTNNNSNNNNGGAAGTQNVQGASAGPVTGDLNVWAMGNEGDKLSVLATQFEQKNPGVHVHITTIGWGEAHDKIVTAIAGHTTPDMSQMGTTWMGGFVKANAFQTVPSSINQSDFFPASWQTGVVNGQSYGVPWYADTRMLFYRKDLAEKAGIMSPPATWQDVYNMAQALKTKAGTQWGISATVGMGSFQDFLPMFWSFGADIQDQSGNYTLNTPQAVQAIAFYQSLFQNGLAPKAVPQGFDITPAFVKGTHPMTVTGPWEISLIEKAGGGDSYASKIGLAPIPKQQTATSFMGGSDLVVYKDAKNPAAAWAFVKFLSQPDVQATWYQTVSDLPAVKAAWSQGKLASDPMLQAFGQQLNSAKAPPPIPNWDQLAAALDNILEKVAAGAETPDQAAKDMQSQAQSIGNQ